MDTCLSDWLTCGSSEKLMSMAVGDKRRPFACLCPWRAERWHPVFDQGARPLDALLQGCLTHQVALRDTKTFGDA